MMHKAILIFSLVFFAVGGFAQNDGGASTSGQPQSNFPSVTPTMASQSYYPSGSPISIPPTGTDGVPSGANSTGLSHHCHPHPHSSLPTDSPLSSGMPDGSSVSKPIWNSTTISGCHPHSKPTLLPTGTAEPYSGGPLPTASDYTASSEPPISTTASPSGKLNFS